jgi:carbonic anhydrase
MRKILVMIAMAGAGIFLAPAGPRAQWKTHWSYEGAEGPDHWGDLDPAYAPCKDGKEQSPIDIRGAQRADLPAITFDYKSGPLRIINNGYTAVRVDYDKGNGNFLIAGGERYELTQFHFHRPSEEYINGKQYDMVLHLMHTSSDGKVAGVAVMLKAGHANPVVEQLWKFMPSTPGPAQEIPGVQVNSAGLMPRDTAYYKYMGSVTAPPCTEGVVWYVLKTPVEVSAAEISAFAKLYPHDVRPPQPLNGRVVEESR